MRPVGGAQATKSNKHVYFQGKKELEVEMSLLPSRNKYALKKLVEHPRTSFYRKFSEVRE